MLSRTSGGPSGWPTRVSISASTPGSVSGRPSSVTVWLTIGGPDWASAAERGQQGGQHDRATHTHQNACLTRTSSA